MRYPPAQQHPYTNGAIHPPADPNPDVLIFAQEEMNMIVKEAKLGRVPVACHANILAGALMAVNAGVDTIEHGIFGARELFELMSKKNCLLCPTLAISERLHKGDFKQLLAQTKMAYDLGVPLACGGDTGTFPHGQGVREIKLFIEAGIALEASLALCTIGGWESCGGDLCGMRFGWFEKGLRVDIIALRTDPREDKYALRRVDFVMKDGIAWKRDGKGVGLYEDDHTWDAEELSGLSYVARSNN